MTTPGYLARLALRATTPNTGLRPRPSTLFERPVADDGAMSPLETAAEAVSMQVAATPDVEPSRVEPTGAELPAVVPDNARVRRIAAAKEAEAPTEAQPTPTVGRSAMPPGRGAQPEPAPMPVTVPVSVPVTVPVSEPPEARSQASAAASSAKPGRQLVASGQQIAGDRPVGPSQEHGVVDNRTVTGIARNQGGSSRSAEIAVAAPNEDPVSRRSGEVLRESADHLTPRDEPPALPWSDAPRLKVPVKAAAPEVTVTIGRIEVVQPDAAEAPRVVPPRRASPRRATSAPTLAAYLRTRSGR